LGASLLMASLLSGAAARPPALFFEWHAPAGCPESSWVLSEVGRVRGRVEVRAGPEGADVDATARVSYLGARWTVRVDTRSTAGSGTRSIEAESCVRAAQAAATVISLALAPFAPPPPPVIAAQPSPPLELAAPQEPPTPPKPSWKLVTGAFATSRVGIMPSVVFGGAVAFGLARNGFKVEVQLDSPAFQTATVPNATAVGQLSLPFAADLRGCRAVTGEETAELALCLEVSGGAIHGQGQGLDTTASGTSPWLSTSGVATLRLRLYGPVGARIEAGGGVSWIHPRFTVTLLAGEKTVYETPWFNARAVAGLDLEL
jgi:hypothetical protein